MEIQVEVKNVYGVLKAYPVNNNAGRLAEIAGAKTITLRNLELAVQMGFKVVEKYGRNWMEVA